MLLTASLLAAAASGCTNASLEDASAGGAATGPTKSVSTSVTEIPKVRALLPQSTRDKGTLVIATDPTYPPFEYFDTDNKTVIGWDADTGTAIAAILGLKPQFVPATFDTILPGLASRKYDLGMSAFSVTAERKKVVDFVSYLSAGSGIAVPPGNPQKLSMDAPTLCGKRIATQKGTSESSDVVPAMSKECTAAGKPAIVEQVFPTQTDANLALISGRVDGVMADSIPLAYQGKLAGKKFELAAGVDYQPRLTGIALNKESGLQAAVAAAMKALIDGKAYAEINERWEIPAGSAISADKVSG